MTRTRTASTLTTLGFVGLLGLSGCGVAASPAAAAVSDEAYALQAVGLTTTPSPAASAPHEKALRRYLRKNTLHGEVTVKGKDGVETIVVQRGTITAVTPTGVSVKSTDGFALTWTFGAKLRVLQDKKKVPTSALKTGAEIGIAGALDGSVDSARLIAVQ